jgi:hypothetical protein
MKYAFRVWTTGLRDSVVGQLLSGLLLVLVLAVPASAVDANLALNQSITAATNAQQGAPGNVVDGDYGTHWYSYQGAMLNSIEFTLDLGIEAEVGQIRFQPLQTNDLTVYSSIDGINWVERHAEALNYDTPVDDFSDYEIRRIVFDSAFQARYFRYLATNNWVAFIGISEFQVYDAQAEFAGGDGSAETPWLISTPEQLSAMRNYLGADHADKHFELVNDIDLTVAPYNSDAGWEPIGTYMEGEDPTNQPFSGSFDGGSHAISGLFIDRPTPHGIGLFGMTAGATIQDLQLVDVNVTGELHIGALVGYAGTGTTISAVSSTGSVVADTRAGGLVGIAYDSTLTDCHSACTASAIDGTNAGGLAGQIEGTTIANSHATGDVSASQDQVGGLVGEARNKSLILDCYATGTVSGRDETGGLVGYLRDSAIENSYATGRVDGASTWRIGGLVGHIYSNASITRSFARGNVSGGNQVGGLVGSVDDPESSISDCFAAGQVEASEHVGGLVGRNHGVISRTYVTGAVSTLNGIETMGGLVGSNVGTVSSSYYNSETSGQTDTGKGEPKTTAELRQQATFASWSFLEVWKINEGISCPYLIWQTFSTFSPEMLAPAIDETVVDLRPTFSWMPLQHPTGGEVVGYEIQISTSPDFAAEDTTGWMVWLIEPEFSGFGLAALLLLGAPLASRSNRRRLSLLALGCLCVALLASGCADSSRPALLVDDEEAAVVSFTPAEELTPGATYYWRVRAQDDQDQWSNWSQPWSFQVPGDD